MGTLNFNQSLGKSQAQFALIPYSNAAAEKNFSLENSSASIKSGADAKIALSDGLNLDITLNPDFSNVEVDDIFTNLTRFELRLPEKRQFFIDNNDLFDSFGNIFNRGGRPFFSRRIGLAQNQAGALIQNDIVAGVRLSGKINENWRLGAFSIQTGEDRENGISAYNNLMTSVQKKVGKRSNVSAFLINKQATGEADYRTENEMFNRVIGADYNLASADNVIRGRFYVHKSFQPGDNEGNISSQAVFFYNPRDWFIVTDIAYIDKDFRADLGFIPRNDVIRLGQQFNVLFIPKKPYLTPIRSCSFYLMIINLRKIIEKLITPTAFGMKLSYGTRHKEIFVFLKTTPISTSHLIPQERKKQFRYRLKQAITITNFNWVINPITPSFLPMGPI